MKCVRCFMLISKPASSSHVDLQTMLPWRLSIGYKPSKLNILYVDLFTPTQRCLVALKLYHTPRGLCL